MATHQPDASERELSRQEWRDRINKMEERMDNTVRTLTELFRSLQHRVNTEETHGTLPPDNSPETSWTQSSSDDGTPERVEHVRAVPQYLRDDVEDDTSRSARPFRRAEEAADLTLCTTPGYMRDPDDREIAFRVSPPIPQRELRQEYNSPEPFRVSPPKPRREFRQEYEPTEPMRDTPRRCDTPEREHGAIRRTARRTSPARAPIQHTPERDHGAIRRTARRTSPPRAPIQHRPRREKEPAKFNGTTPWEDFLNQFEVCRRYNRWNDEESTLQLFSSCTGEALSVITVNELRPEEMTYKELVHEMASEFGPRECAESYFLELSRREQGHNESLHGLGQAIRKLTALAYPKTDKLERDRVARECFKKAISDAEVRKDVFRTRPETLNQAIQAAIECESYYRTEKARSRVKPHMYARPVSEATDHSHIQHRLAQIESLLTQQNTMAPLQYSMAPRVAPAATGQSMGPNRGEVRCYSCNELGHIARNCTSKVNRCFKCNGIGHFARECQMPGNGPRPTHGTMGRSEQLPGPVHTTSTTAQTPGTRSDTPKNQSD